MKEQSQVNQMLFSSLPVSYLNDELLGFDIPPYLKNDDFDSNKDEVVRETLMEAVDIFGCSYVDQLEDLFNPSLSLEELYNDDSF